MPPKTDSFKKYRPYLSQFPFKLENRSWPANQIKSAPQWCSVDLRDGNQALVNPMGVKQKLEMFKLLCEIGFKEIEIGFPSASATEFEFTRLLIDQKLIPEDVIPQVLTQARPHLIEKTFESLIGARKAIFHVYNSTSELQRRVVFKKEKEEIIQIAVEAVSQIRDMAANFGSEIILEYSPESFTGTEIDFSIKICESVIEEWQKNSKQKIIVNLPATVEMSTPNVYADLIEYFIKRIKFNENVTISLHPHNDRGTAVAATELGLLAGATRVEGTLFGNGERTGNVDIVTLALNMLTQGIDPQLNFSDINHIKNLSDKFTQIPVGARHPYAGELVFTAFSGSHQDAIRKGLLERDEARDLYWEVPYLPIDPDDVGRKYDPIIRINSQSGKGGVAYRMENDYGFSLPKAMHPEFGALVQKVSDATGQEISGKQIWDIFSDNYLNLKTPLNFIRFKSAPFSEDDNEDRITAVLKLDENGKERELPGVGNGPIDACKDALIKSGILSFKLTDFFEHSLSSGSDAEAAAYIQIETEDGNRYYGAGVDANTTKASIKALVCAVNRAKA